MSDVSLGAGWWKAQDGKWYAPELHPNAVPAAPIPQPGLPPQHTPIGQAPRWEQSGPGHDPAQPPPRKSRKALWLGLSVAAFLGLMTLGGCALFLVADSADDGGFFEDFDSDVTPSSDSSDSSDGVIAEQSAQCSVTGLQTDGTDDYEVIAEVDNVSDEESDYYLDYELSGPDGESLGTDYGVVYGVEAGASVSESTVGIIAETVPWSEVGCTVTRTQRTPTN